MRPRSHTGKLIPDVVLTHRLNPFSLDYSVHFFMPVVFFSFHHIAFSPLFGAKEGKNENKN